MSEDSCGTVTASFYDPATGHFAGRTFTGPKAHLQRNTPPGAISMLGRHDSMSRRVDVATGAVVDWQPPQPDGDHEWNEESRRWVKRAAVLAREERRARAVSRIKFLEESQHRAIREATLNQPGAQQRLQAIDDEIAVHREALRATLQPDVS